MQSKKIKGRRAEKDFSRSESKTILREDKQVFFLFSTPESKPEKQTKPADGLFHFQQEAGEEGDAEWAAAEAELIREDSSCLL